MDGTPPVDLSLIGVSVAITSGANPTKFILVHRRYESGAYNWKVYESGNLIATDTTHGDGTATIACEQDGDALNWAVSLDADEIATGAIESIDWTTISETTVHVVSSRPTAASWSNGTGLRCTDLLITKTDTTEVHYPWDESSELDDWVNGDKWASSSGYIYQVYNNWNLRQAFPNPETKQVTACLARPGVERTVACTDDGQLSERYEAQAFTDILSGDALDAHPELCYTGAAGIGHLALVWQRDDDVVCATSSGVPTSGWSDVATVREDRSYPTACVIAPTHDLYVVAIESSVHIAHGQRLRWKGTSYDIGTESIVSSGDVADERGHVLCAPGNVLVYTYADTSGDIQVLRSSDGGSTWA
jgi:hypothetical protein